MNNAFVVLQYHGRQRYHAVRGYMVGRLPASNVANIDAVVDAWDNQNAVTRTAAL